MRLIIRADGHRAIGAGHVMRCLALAQAWRRRGGTVTFVAFVDSDALAARLAGGSDELVRLAAPHPAPGAPGPDGDADGDALLGVAAASPGAPVALDGYGFDPAYHRRVRDAGHRLLVLDDHAHLASYDVDWVLNQNAVASPALYRGRGSGARLLLGPTYALLRAEFLAYQGWARPAAAAGARRVLVSLGGSDPANVTARALRGIIAALAGVAGARARVIAGHSSAHAAELRSLAAAAPVPCEVLHGVDDMPAQMTWADLAVGAAGVTIWEMAYLQLPALLVTTADNQGTNAAWAAAHGAALDLGVPDAGLEARVAAAAGALALANGGRALAGMAAAGRALVDGQGADRVAGVLAPGRDAD